MAQIRENVSLELHLFPRNRHGLSLATGETAWEDAASADPHAAVWFPLYIRWLNLI